MHHIIDLARYPLDRPGSDDWTTLIARCRDQLDQQGSLTLTGFFWMRRGMPSFQRSAR